MKALAPDRAITLDTVQARKIALVFEVPETKDVRINHVSTFSGRSGGIDHPINGRGEATNVGETKFFDGLNPESRR